MFRRNGKPHGDDKGEGGNPPEDALAAPPLKPFSSKGSHLSPKPPSAVYRPDVRPAPEVSAPGRRTDRPRPAMVESNKLIVGRDIRLKGEISACSRLVVEGYVEASLTDARAIEVAPSGHFKSNAEVDEAEISGRYEGELVAREKLTVRANGRIHGSIRYGRIVIEAGGEISGDMKSLNGPTTGGTFPGAASGSSSGSSQGS